MFDGVLSYTESISLHTQSQYDVQAIFNALHVDNNSVATEKNNLIVPSSSIENGEPTNVIDSSSIVENATIITSNNINSSQNTTSKSSRQLHYIKMLTRETSEKALICRQNNVRQVSQFFQRESQMKSQARLEADSEHHRLMHQNESPAQTQVLLEADSENHRLLRQNESPAQTQARLEADSEHHRLLRQNESPAQTQACLEADSEHHRLLRQNESPVQTQN
ncbi:hypothetical protein DSO57_1025583 [Entomophthora muscae]|uniref:Uncharacterized protein n=1 Tax=Entomophthora muscae TaxID=34485 RepID=A0ACC2T254_9FUNG|nr:hypothetical protein DSO57_1025583 [Entomophthora muscae]